VLVALLIAPAFALSPHADGKRRSKTGASKKKSQPASITQAAFDAALDAQKPAIVDCFMEHGIKKGADSVQLNIKVLINRTGQVFGTELTVTQVGGDQDAMSACVKQTLTLTHFPQNNSSLTELRRVWTFSAKT
jgi:hypothetical protein